MEYIVRLREVIIHEFCVEAETARGAFLTAIKKAHKQNLSKTTAVGRFLELENIKTGSKNAIEKPDHYGITKQPKKRKRMDKSRKAKGNTN